MHWHRLVRLALAAVLAITILLPPSTLSVSADTGERTLYLYHTHTHETARITFKRNGVYDQAGLQQLNWFLRDFRTNQPSTMAPQLFDLVWEVYQKVGATQPINIVSAYRSPATNAYLHARSSAVAVHSQHMLGHAMDFFIPGIPLTKLRAVGMQQQVGGVGFYPTSGSPFVHMDVGTVRAWPRMTTAQLQSIFPDGRTLHVPADGRVLSSAGMQYAQAQWNSCHAVPCTNAASLKGGAASLGYTTMVAAATTSATGKTFGDIARGVNPGNTAMSRPPAETDDESADDAVTAGPAQMAVATVSVKAPVPMSRPAEVDAVQTASIDAPASPAADGTSLFPDAIVAGNGPIPPAPIPAQKSFNLMLATGEMPRAARPQSAVAAIASLEAPLPAMRSQTSADDAAGDAMISAYAAADGGLMPAQHVLQAIIESETTGAAAISPASGTSLTNSVNTPLGADALKTYAAQRRVGNGAAQSLANVAPIKSFTARKTELVTPGLAEGLSQPVAMSSATFAVFVQPEARDLSPATELGALVNRLGFHSSAPTSLSSNRFAPAGNFLLASR